MTEAWVDMEYHLRIKVTVPRGTSEEDIFEKAYETAMRMDPDEMVRRLDMEYWEVM